MHRFESDFYRKKNKIHFRKIEHVLFFANVTFESETFRKYALRTKECVLILIDRRTDLYESLSQDQSFQGQNQCQGLSLLSPIKK